jgi:dTMP kinase
MKRGKFIVIEGGEGSGKTTQIANLKALFSDTLFTREIGGTEFAEKGPRYLVLTSPYAKDLNGYEQITQAFSGRSHHIRTVIAPAVKKGTNVFCDRFDSSSFAIQIYGMECEHLLPLFDELRKAILPNVMPDLYIILDVSPEVSKKRAALRAAQKGDSNHMDEKDEAFYARVRDGYHRFAKKFAKQCVMIDATPSKEEVWQEVKKAVEAVL